MSRITGSDAQGMMEAYAAVYAPQELTEEQVWEEVEAWVNSLLEEGYDLSEYTWEEMYEEYITEIGVNFGGQSAVDRVRAQASAERQSAAKIDAARQQRFGGGRSGGATTRSELVGSNRPAAALPKPTFQNTGGYGRYAPPSMQQKTVVAAPQRPGAPAPSGANAPAPRPGAPAGQTVAAAGGAGGQVTVGRQYAATQGGVQGNVTYNAQGQKTFTPNKPAAGTPAPAPGGAPAGNRVIPTSATTTTTTNTPSTTPARPSLQSGIQDLQRMRAASLMRQQGRNMPDGSIPTGSSLAPRPTSAPSGVLASTAAAASRPAAFNPAPAASSVRKPAPTRSPILQRQSFDPFDVVMGHLIDEGYAEDEKAAAVIMVNMSEEWREEILNEVNRGEQEMEMGDAVLEKD